MFGFAIGTLSLVGLLLLLAGGHHRRHRRWGRRFGALHWAMHRLETTPGQEKEIREALGELREQARSAREELRASRSDVANALRSARLDAGDLDQLLHRHDPLLERMRTASANAVARIHATLDERQRDRLASLVESGPGFAGWHAAC